MTCATCRATGPDGSAWCPACYLPYARPDAVPTSARQRPVVPQPAQQHASWVVRGIVVSLAGLLGYGIFVGVRHGMACQTGAIHPHVKQVDAAVHQDLAVVQRLANAPKSEGWTLADGRAVLAADATMTATLTQLRLSPEDRAVVTTWLTHVAHFDAALGTYMANDSDANHKLFGTGALELQKGADDLSTGLAALPKRCRLS